MTRKKTTKRPVRRRPAAKSSSAFGKMGWMAATVIATGWLVSDGRAVAYVGSFLPQPETNVAAVPRPEPVRSASARQPNFRQTSLRAASDTDNERRPAASIKIEAPMPPKPVRTAPAPTHVASIVPSPAPRPAPMRSLPKEAEEEVPHPRPVLAPMRQPVVPPLAARSMVPAPMTAAIAPAGGLRHATRLLIMRDSPDDAGKHVGSVVSGMQVEVLKAAGHWRYVKTEDGEGWVDGSFLAGESAALAVPAPPTVLAAMPAAPAPRLPPLALLPPMAISAR